MYNIKHFSRSIRQEINRISIQLKQMEFRILRLRGLLKKKLREQIMELKRMKDAIVYKISKLTNETVADLSVMQSIRSDIDVLHERCRQLKMQRI